MAEKNHTLREQFFEKKIDLCQKHDEVTQFDGNGFSKKRFSSNRGLELLSTCAAHRTFCLLERFSICWGKV